GARRGWRGARRGATGPGRSTATRPSGDARRSPIGPGPAWPRPLARSGRAAGGSVLIRLHGRAGAEEVPVAVGLVDPADRRPVLGRPQPGDRVGRLGPRVRVGPLVRGHVLGRVR